MPFHAGDLREIWRQHVNRCRHQSFRKRITKFFEKVLLTPKTRLFEPDLRTGITPHRSFAEDRHRDDCNFSSVLSCTVSEI